MFRQWTEEPCKYHHFNKWSSSRKLEAILMLPSTYELFIYFMKVKVALTFQFSSVAQSCPTLCDPIAHHNICSWNLYRSNNKKTFYSGFCSNLHFWSLIFALMNVVFISNLIHLFILVLMAIRVVCCFRILHIS